MTRPPIARAALAAALLAVVVAACGTSSSPSPAPTSPATATPPSTPTASATAAPGSPAPARASPAVPATAEPSVLPSFTRVADLEAMLPKKVGDSVLAPRSLTGTDVLATGDAASIAALQAILDATAAKPADYQFAYSPFKTGAGDDAVVGIFRVTGADPQKIRDVLIAQAQAGGVGAAEDGLVGGKKVKVLRATDASGATWSLYYWPKGDVLFYVQTVDPRVAEEVLAGL